MSNQNCKKSPAIEFALFNCTGEMNVDNFGYLNSSLYLYFVTKLPEKFMAYVYLQLNLPLSPYETVCF